MKFDLHNTTVKRNHNVPSNHIKLNVAFDVQTKHRTEGDEYNNTRSNKYDIQMQPTLSLTSD